MKLPFTKPTKVILINGYVNSINNKVLVLILINSKKIRKSTTIKIYKHLYSKFRILFGDVVNDSNKIISYYNFLTKARKPYNVSILNEYYRVYFIKQGKRKVERKITQHKWQTKKQLNISNQIKSIGKAKKITPLRTIKEVFSKL